MQNLYLAAGVISALTGMAHSVFGERLIFRPLRDGRLVPARGAPPLRERHVRIIWATWHLASVFGCAAAGILVRLAFAPASPASDLVVGIALAHLGGAVLVLVGTKGRHPGWLALFAVALLIWLAKTAS